MRASPGPLVQAHAHGHEHRTLARLLAGVVELLGARLDKLPEVHHLVQTMDRLGFGGTE